MPKIDNPTLSCVGYSGHLFHQDIDGADGQQAVAWLPPSKWQWSICNGVAMLAKEIHIVVRRNLRG
jgi:hypothetical protein